MRNKSRAAARKFWEVVPRVMSTVAAEARRGGHRLEPNHFRTLKMLSYQCYNLSELAEHQAVSLPSMSASVQTLVERGWVQRRETPKDRRVTELEVTEKGKRVLEHEYLRLLGWTAKRLNKLSEVQLEQVELGLDTLLTVFEDERISKLRAVRAKMDLKLRSKLVKKLDGKMTKLNSRLSFKKLAPQ